MPEIILNLHIHSTLSDGSGSYAEIAKAAIRSNLDAIILTDHNVLPHGKEGYYDHAGKRVLVLTGEEIHDQVRTPQKNHLLVFNTKQDYSHLADQTQVLLDRVREAGGLAFLAHPFEAELPAFKEPDISWVDWSIHGFHGIELWNGFSEIKHVSRNTLEAVFYALFPEYLAHQPHPMAFRLWNEILCSGQRITAVGGADAHQLVKHLGPIHKRIYPYEYHFRSINNHLLLPAALSGDVSKDRKAIYSALRNGQCYIGYDLPHPTSGFLFTAQGQGKTVSIGGEINGKNGVTFQVKTPATCKILLIHNGKVIQRWKGGQVCTYTTNQAGHYRVEAWIEFLGKRRAWILSNPIYVRNE